MTTPIAKLAQALTAGTTYDASARHEQVLADELRSLLRDPARYGVTDCRGLFLYGARIVGRLVLDELEIPFAVTLHDCLMMSGSSMMSLRVRRLDLSGCVLEGPVEEGLRARDCTVDSDFVLDRTKITGLCKTGAVDLSGSHIGGELTMRGATLRNPHGPSLRAERIAVGGGVRLTKGFRAEGEGTDGAVRFSRSALGAQLLTRGATIINSSGPALAAYDARVGGLYLDQGFTAVGCGEKGTVRLVGVRAEGMLTLRQASLSNPSGPAVLADRADVSGDFFIDKADISGGGAMGAVRMFGGRIGGQLTMRSSTVVNPRGPGFCLIRSSVGGDLNLNLSRISGSRSESVVNLSGTSLAGEFSTVGITVASSESEEWRWMLNGFTYSGVPLPDDRHHWIRLLRRGTPKYLPQPYQQLVAAFHSAGHDGDARELLISQRDDQVQRGALSKSERAWAKFTGLTLGYGWKPRRALYLLLAVLAISVTLSVVLGVGGLAQREANTPTRTCSIVQEIEVGLRPGNPVVGSTSKASDTCTPNLDSWEGQTLVVASWGIQLAAWGSAALFIAGFTSAVRKS